MEVYRSETREILKRFSEHRISRAECVDALDCALLAAVPHLAPADLREVLATLAENSRMLSGNLRKNRSSDSIMENYASTLQNNN